MSGPSEPPTGWPGRALPTGAAGPSAATLRDGPVAAALGDAVREHWASIVALLIAQFQRPDLAEDAAAHAIETAATAWAADIPRSPGAWLLTTARRHAIDQLRREATIARKVPLLVVDDEMRARAAATQDPGAHLSDERLRLIFCCVDPAVGAADRVALTLRFVIGLPTAQIAQLLVAQEATLAARLTRAKKRLAAQRVAFTTPAPEVLDDRLDDVARVLYLLFTSGYQPSDGPSWLRVDLADEAIRLARELDRRLPGRGIVIALLALMLLQHSRRDARTDADGRIVLLADQDRSRWHRDEITEGVALLAGFATTATGTTPLAAELGWQAMIAAEHATAPTPRATRWPIIAAHYRRLDEHTGSPVVRLARAVAEAEAVGPEAGLAVLDGVDAALPRHHRVPAVRGELLARAGRSTEALAELRRALTLVTASAERDHLLRRIATIEAATHN